MLNSFQFKQFAIQQDLSAMKVGTDAVLLGAWLTPKEGDLLDIGTGTGLLSLMLAQRTSTAQIDAIDVDENAYQQAMINVGNSPWKNRVHIQHQSIQLFKTEKKYDLIFSNPPYFINSSKASEEARNRARHADELPYNQLIVAVKRLLKREGIFAVVLPVNEAQLFIEEAKGRELFLNRKCSVKPNINKIPKRVLMEFSYAMLPVIEEELTIETEKRHQYTKEYINLTQDFYLNF
ncbi:MAG: methyltransferase [Vicingus serpentipes]|nr:methyltransferase [Vicingus serpentipes]